MGALNELQDTSFHLYQRNDSLLRLIDSIQDDSTCYQLVELYTQIIANQKDDYAKMVEKYKHIPPVIKTIQIKDTVLDIAAVKACESDKNVAINLLDKMTKERDDYKQKAKKRGWIMWGLIFLLVGSGATWVYFKFKK